MKASVRRRLLKSLVYTVPPWLQAMKKSPMGSKYSASGLRSLLLSGSVFLDFHTVNWTMCSIYQLLLRWRIIWVKVDDWRLFRRRTEPNTQNRWILGVRIGIQTAECPRRPSLPTMFAMALEGNKDAAVTFLSDDRSIAERSYRLRLLGSSLHEIFEIWGRYQA